MVFTHFMASAQKRQISSKIKKSCPWRDNCGITKKYYGGFLIIFFPPGNIKVCHPNGCFIACHQLLCAAYSHPTTSSHSRSLFDTYTWLKPLRCADIIPVIVLHERNICASSPPTDFATACNYRPSASSLSTIRRGQLQNEY